MQNALNLTMLMMLLLYIVVQLIVLFLIVFVVVVELPFVIFNFSVFDGESNGSDGILLL